MEATIWLFPKIRGPQYRPQNIIVLIIGTPKRVPLILGNPHLGFKGSAQIFPSCFGAPKYLVP